MKTSLVTQDALKFFGPVTDRFMNSNGLKDVLSGETLVEGDLLHLRNVEEYQAFAGTILL